MRKSKASHQIRAAARTALIDSLESRLLFTVLPSGFGEMLVAANIVSPTSMAFAPDGRLFVAEKSGALRVIKNGFLFTTPVVTVDASTFSERGLGGVAVDPHFEDNGFIYLYYTAETPDAHNRISRFTISPGSDIAPLSSEHVLLDLPDAGNGTAHNGGAMQFLPDGTLIIGVGDHTNALNGQDMSTPFGKILRINADGSIPNDNPFYDTTTGVSRAIWSLGVRNPFTMDVQPGTGRVFINDVGAADWEEINEGAPGGNFGWATTEGPFNSAAFPEFTNPFYAYGHDEGAAVTGGAFYNPQAVQFPADNVGQYFFADFAAGFIRRLNPHTKQVTPFATGAFGAVDLDIGPDGSLYWLSRFDNAVYRIRATLAPQVSAHPQSQLISAGESVTFSVGASGANLNYQWQRDGIDIVGADAASYTIAAAVLADSGAHFRCIVSNVQGSTMSNTATLTVTADQPPVPTIVTPTAGTTYRGGMNVSYSGIAIDSEDGALAGAQMTWWVDFHHADHVHPFLPPVAGATSGEFEIPTLVHGAANVWYRINLSVTDSAGFTRTTYRDLQPQLATITVQTAQPGLQLSVDGQPRQAPIVMTGVVNTIRTLSAAQIQQVGGLNYDFLSWSHGGAATHQIFIPDTDTTYTANYQPYTVYYLSDREWFSQSGTLPPVRDGNQWGSSIVIGGVEYARGLGVSAYSNIMYSLGGEFERFQTTVGVDDGVGDLGSVSFQVWVDGVKRFDSGLMTGSMPNVDVDLDVTGANALRLYVTDGGDGPGSDQANWGNARFTNLSHSAPAPPQQLTALAPNYNRVLLTWRDSSTDEASFLVERSSDGGVNFQEVGSVGAGVSRFVDAYRAPGTTYHYRVRARNAIGDSVYTAVADATTPDTTLGASWSEADVGDVAPDWSGSASQNVGESGITITGSGLGIGTEADAMHFVFQQMDGDGRITARLTDWIGLNYDNAAAGIMIRESLAPNARSVALLNSAGASSSFGFVRREITGGDTMLSYGPHIALPVWLRIERIGDTFTAYTSNDGVTFTAFDMPRKVTMGAAAVYVGIAITSMSRNSTSTAAFDNISVSNSTPTIVSQAAVLPNPVTGVTAALSALGADDEGEANLTYTWSVLSKPAGAADPTFSVNGTNASKETIATFAKAGEYQFRVRISDGVRLVDSRVDVIVAQTVSSIAVTPASVTVSHDRSYTFVAVASDQFGDALAVQPAFAWSVSEGDGSITSAGVYTAPSQLGGATVTASVGDVTASADITIAKHDVGIAQPPTAWPSPANGVVAHLSVLGSSDGGEDALTYTWTATAVPAGAFVLFSVNGTNAAKNATASFTRAGSYTFSVMVTDGTVSASGEVIVVVEQTAESIAILPGIIQLAPGEPCQYSAIVVDQFGHVITDPGLDWSVTGDGTIDEDGLYTPGQTQGTYAVTANVGDTSESVEVIVDFTGPVATWNTAPPPAIGATEWVFQVFYTDAHGVDVATLGDDDISVVIAPDGGEFAAEFLAVDFDQNGLLRTATYRVNVEGALNAVAAGTWTISVNAQSVFDIFGNAAAAGEIGTFRVAPDFATVAPDGLLLIDGTDEADLLELETVEGDIVVTLNGNSLTFASWSVTDIEIRGYGGDDTIDVAGIDQTIDYLGGGADVIRAIGGTLTLGADVGVDDASVAVNVLGGASVRFIGTQHLAALNLFGTGAASIDDTASDDVIVVGTLSLDAASVLDIGSGAMIVQHTGVGWASSSGAYNGVTRYLASAYAFGAWSGPGITSRFAAAAGDGITGVGVAPASAILGLESGSAIGAWRGEAVTGDSVLITYAYAGDANLDGLVDAADYGVIDNWVQFPGTDGYCQGDFNFDGVIDAADYGIIDNTIQLQGPPLA